MKYLLEFFFLRFNMDTIWMQLGCTLDTEDLVKSMDWVYRSKFDSNSVIEKIFNNK